MAEHQAINMQPTQQHNNPGFQPKKYDENGEEVVFEGVCNKTGVCGEVFWIYFYASVVSLLGMIILIPIGIICSIKATRDWKLYLTRNRVVYRQPIGMCCCDTNYNIPFSDIQDISTVPGTKDILVRMDPEKVCEYIHWCNRPACGTLIGLVLSNAANREDFVAAVKREMGN